MIDKINQFLFGSIWRGIAAFLAWLLITVNLSELIFGDLTNEDSAKPLFVIIPMILFVVWWGYVSIKRQGK